MAVSVVIPAAGSGRRFGSALPKQFVELAGKPILVHTALAFEQSDAVDTIVIAAHPSFIEDIWELARRFGITKIAACVAGGSERQHSILQALATPEVQQSDIVLVHDAVRPFVESALITSIAQAARQHGAVVPGLPPKDTIKEVDTANAVVRTCNRSTMRTVQTPQGFSRTVLHEAYQHANAKGFLGTDDASVVEYAGYSVRVVEGSEENIKITTPFDMRIAEMLVQQRSHTSASPL